MGGGKGGEVGGGYGAKLRDERHLAKLVQLARTPDEKGFGDRRIRLVTNFLIGIIHLYRPAGGTTPTPTLPPSCYSRWTSIFHLDGNDAPFLLETEFKRMDEGE